MNHYIEIKIKKNKKVKAPNITNSLMSSLHIAIIESKENVGVSFPGITENHLGEVIRIHGSKESLVKLGFCWISKSNVMGHIEFSDILEIPENVQYVSFRRLRPMFTESKLRNLLKKKPLSDDEIKDYKIKIRTEFIDSPFLNLKSHSNRQHFKLFLGAYCREDSGDGLFDNYGFSKTAAVPVF